MKRVFLIIIGMLFMCSWCFAEGLDEIAIEDENLQPTEPEQLDAEEEWAVVLLARVDIPRGSPLTAEMVLVVEADKDRPQVCRRRADRADDHRVSGTGGGCGPQDKGQRESAQCSTDF